jgi:secreted trypsin-like serine protease
LTTNDVSLTLGNGIIYSKQPVTLGITGGSKISVSSSMLALSTVALMNNQQSFCTGTLISDSYVVTAAHCIDAALTMPKENLFIGFGENGSKKVKVQSLIKHEEYTDQNLNKGFTPQANYDLGLVKLSGTIPKPYRPVAILPASEQFISNEKVYIAGYGLDEKGSVGTLKASFSMFAEESSAAVNFRTVSALTQSTCNGDSGGPAYVVRGDYYYLVGATSYGPSGFYCRGGDSFFVDLRKVASWIESRIN